MQKAGSGLSKRAAAAILAGAMLMTLSLAGCTGNDGGNGDASSQVTEVSKETKFGNDIVVKSEHFTISRPIAEYLHNYLYKSFLSTYGAQYFDTTQSLKTQYVDEEKTQSWNDYFIQRTKNYIQSTLATAEAATAADVELNETDLASISEGFDAMSSVAAEESLTVDQYIAQNYGVDVKKKDIEEIQKITLLAQKYSNQLYDDLKYTDEQYEKYYEENPQKMNYADYLAYTFSYATTDSEGSTVVDESKKKDMKENADALANSKSVKEFDEYLTQYLRSNPDQVTVKTESSESSITEDDFNNALKDTVSSTHFAKQPYSMTTEADLWIYDSNRKDGDTTVLETETGYTVIYLEKTQYRDESTLRDVRHILIQVDDDTPEDKAKSKAESIYEEWQNGDATEESFANLAMDYSEDQGSASKGGLYEGVYEGKMVEEFNDWLFDGSRKPGDTGIVETTYGFHIMYYVGEGLTAWKSTADSALRTQDMNTTISGLVEEYEVEFDDEAFADFELSSVS